MATQAQICLAMAAKLVLATLVLATLVLATFTNADTNFTSNVKFVEVGSYVNFTCETNSITNITISSYDGENWNMVKSENETSSLTYSTKITAFDEPTSYKCYDTNGTEHFLDIVIMEYNELTPTVDRNVHGNWSLYYLSILSFRNLHELLSCKANITDIDITYFPNNFTSRKWVHYINYYFPKYYNINTSHIVPKFFVEVDEVDSAYITCRYDNTIQQLKLFDNRRTPLYIYEKNLIPTFIRIYLQHRRNVSSISSYISTFKRTDVLDGGEDALTISIDAVIFDIQRNGSIKVVILFECRRRISIIASFNNLRRINMTCIPKNSYAIINANEVKNAKLTKIVDVENINSTFIRYRCNNINSPNVPILGNHGGSVVVMDTYNPTFGGDFLNTVKLVRP